MTAGAPPLRYVLEDGWPVAEMRRRYSGSPWYGLAVRHKIALLSQTPLLEAFGEHGTVVDMGCGFGMLALLLALARPGLTVIGVDPDPGRVARASAAARGVRNVSFSVGDARTWALPPCCGIVFFDVLHHLRPGEQDEVIAASGRALLPGGALIIYDIDPDCPTRWRYWMSHAWDLFLYPFSVRGQFRTGSEFRAAAARAGLTPGRALSLKSAVNAPVMYEFRKPGEHES